MGITCRNDRVEVCLMIRDTNGDFIATLSKKEDEFLEGMLEGSLDIAIKTIWADRKRRELFNDLER